MEDYQGFFKENNPIPTIFFGHQWKLDYAFCVGEELFANYISYKIDKTGNLAKVVNGAITLAELYCIEGNRELLRLAGYKKQYPPLEVEIFRIDY